MASSLTSILGWQRERRRALALLRQQGQRAAAKGDYALLEALNWAAWDVEDVLRDMARATITEGMHMQWANPAQSCGLQA